MQILKFPDPHLFVKTKEVTVFGPELKFLLESMKETMTISNGLGLAANQVGLPYSMFVMQTSNDGVLFLVNPKITNKSMESAGIREGCLSAPGEFLVVPERKFWSEVEFQNENGESQKIIFKGIFSVCAQHEIQHLLGESYMQSKSILKTKRKQLAKKWGLK